MKTYMPKKNEVEDRWFVADADGKTLGRLATSIARALMGKGRPQFAPHVCCGDHVIVVNAARVRLTGRKTREKTYYRHTGFPGGLRQEAAFQVLERKPERLVEAAVSGMLPKSRLGRSMLKKLRVYAGPEHPHEAQLPQPLPGARQGEEGRERNPQDLAKGGK